MRKLGYIIFAAALLSLAGCMSNDNAAADDSMRSSIVATVDGQHLTREELRRDMPSGLSEADSVTFSRMYIDNWVLNRLKLRRAEKVLAASYEDVERLVEDYRQSLIMRRLDQYYVDQAINLEITDQQIASHYRANAASFRLDHNKVRGVVVKVPNTFRNKQTMLTALNEVRDNGIAELQALVEKHGLVLTDMSGEWVSYSDFLSNLPTERSSSYDVLLTRSGVQQMSGVESTFYFIILDVARKGDVAPLESVREDICRRLYSERRAEIVRNYELELRQEAVEGGRVDIPDTVLMKSMYYVPEVRVVSGEVIADEEIIEEEIIEEEQVAVSEDGADVAEK